MKELIIEWRYCEEADKEGLRCSPSGKTLHQVVSELREELAQKSIRVDLEERQDAQESGNMLYFNGRPLDEVLLDILPDENAARCCCSKSWIEPFFKSVSYADGSFEEEIPQEVIRSAALKVAEKL